MSNLVLFKPRRELSAEKNLAAFVAMCRDELTALGADLPFDEMKWDVTNHIKLKGKMGRCVQSSARGSLPMTASRHLWLSPMPLSQSHTSAINMPFVQQNP